MSDSRISGHVLGRAIPQQERTRIRHCSRGRRLCGLIDRCQRTPCPDQDGSESTGQACIYCNGTGIHEPDNNGPIRDCPVCRG